MGSIYSSRLRSLFYFYQNRISWSYVIWVSFPEIFRILSLLSFQFFHPLHHWIVINDRSFSRSSKGVIIRLLVQVVIYFGKSAIGKSSLLPPQRWPSASSLLWDVFFFVVMEPWLSCFSFFVAVINCSTIIVYAQKMV